LKFLKLIYSSYQLSLILVLGLLLNACTFEATLNKNSAAADDSASTDKIAPDISNVILDGGISSIDTSISPSFSWSDAIDGESGISYYEVALGTTLGGVETQNWVNIGLVTNYQFTGLSLTPGQTYYFSFRAVDKAGNTSAPMQDNGFQVLTCNPAITNAFGAGNGTLGDPYRICNLNQWNYFAETTSSWDKYIKLESDLDFTGINFANFKTIGTTGTPFSGFFDGNNLTIKNININAGATGSAALFMETIGSVTIQNLNLKNFNMTTTSGAFAGLILNHDKTSSNGGTLTISNITAEDLIYSNGSGLVDLSGAPVDISNIELSHIELGSGSGTYSSGGIIGEIKITGGGSFRNITINDLTAGFSMNRWGGILGSSEVSTGTQPMVFENIQITNLDFNTGGGGAAAGGLATSLNNSSVSITDVHIEANSGIKGSVNTGGLVGVIYTAATISINNSSFSGYVYGHAGIIGAIPSNSLLTMSQVYAKGNVEKHTGIMGGLIGQLASASGSIISNSYSHMNLNYTSSTISGHQGGLIGWLQSSKSIIIQNSYSTGTLTSAHTSTYRGCIMGRNQGTLGLAYVFFDSDRCTNNAVNSAAAFGANGLSTGSLQTATPFTNWSTLIWSFLSGQDPKLVWEP